MEIAIRSIGNSKGVVIPKALLVQAGLESQAFAAITIENGSIVLRKPPTLVRQGWAEAAAAVAADGQDAPLLEAFSNDDDADLQW